MVTPQEFVTLVRQAGIVGPSWAPKEKLINEFIDSASATQLKEGLRLVLKSKTPFNAGYIDNCLTALDIRLAEEATAATERHIGHTEKLTNQTETLIAESRNLTAQNKILIDESKNLTRLTKDLKTYTIGLFALTIVVAVLTGVLVWAEFRKETHTVEVITNPVTVTNVPVIIVVTNFSAPINTNH